MSIELEVNSAFSPLQLSRTERRKMEKLARIKKAARLLFDRKGFEKTTIRAIADAADVGVGTVFLYAASKEELLVMIFREEMGNAVERALATMPAAALLDRLMHVLRAMIAHHERNPGLARLFVKELPFVDDSRHGVADFMKLLYDGMESLIEDAKGVGELRAGVPARLLAQNLFALYFQHIQTWLAGRMADAHLSRLRETLDLHLLGLRNDRRNNGSRGEKRWVHGQAANFSREFAARAKSGLAAKK